MFKVKVNLVLLSWLPRQQGVELILICSDILVSGCQYFPARLAVTFPHYHPLASTSVRINNNNNNNILYC